MYKFRMLEAFLPNPESKNCLAAKLSAGGGGGVHKASIVGQMESQSYPIAKKWGFHHKDVWNCN